MSNSLFATIELLAAGNGHSSSPSPLEVDPDLTIFTAILFVILLVILYRFAWKPIMAGLDSREKSIADDIAAAQEANEKAQANLRQYETKLAAAAGEVDALLAEAKQDAEKVKERIVAEASSEAQRQRDRAIADIEAAKNQAVRELAEKSVDSAVSLAGNLVGRELDANAHSKLINDSLERFVQNP